MQRQIPLSSEVLTNPIDDLGLPDHSARKLWPGTIAQLEARGLTLQGEVEDAKGATAVVHLLKEPTGRKLILKACFDPGNTFANELFDREARILASPDLPHDVLHHYLGGFSKPAPPSTSGPPCQPFLILEYIDGTKLAARVREWGESGPQHKPATLQQRVELAIQICRALHRLHTSHLVHGDVSPNNILIQRGGRIRLIDLGQGGRLAKGMLSLNTVSGKLGTPGFSPDALLKQRVKTCLFSDLRQLAAVVYYVLTGSPPGGQPEAEGADSWATELRRAQVPRRLRAIVMKGLRDRNLDLKDQQPDPRLYNSAEELARALERWSISRTRFWPRVRSSLVVAGLLFVGGWGWYQWLQEQHAAGARQAAELRAELNVLPQAGHPAVQGLLAQAASVELEID